MNGPHVIRYRYPGTTNGGQPVGLVYLQDVADEVPGYPRGSAYSYTKNPQRATTFDGRLGAQEIIDGHARSWPEALPIPVEIAPPLD